MRLAAVSLIAGLIASPLSLAQSAWDLVFREQLDWTSREHRLILARDLADRISLLESTLPELSEKDHAWLKKLEQRIERLGDNNASSERGKLYLSRQYQHRTLLAHMKVVKRELDCVRGATKLPEEMLCWGEVSVQLLDGDRIGVALETLRDHRMIPRPREMPFTTLNPSLWYSEFGRGIVEYLLVPYLESRLGSDEGAND